MRMFVAVRPSGEALDDLEAFLAPRRVAAQAGSAGQAPIRWTDPAQWHLTLAFLGEVADRRLDDLVERLARAAARRTPGSAAVAGGGAFPHAARAKVLYAGITASDQDAEELRRLATGARSAGAKAGAPVGGGRFRPHLTLARFGVPIEATRWIRVVETYRGPSWPLTHVELIASHLGEGPRRRPRYETVQTFAIGRSTPSSSPSG